MSAAGAPRQRPRGTGRVITVFSPKGGTGKTVMATNLAASFAKYGGKKTLLLDLDLQFGDAAIMLGIEPEKTIHDLVTAPGELDPEKLAGYTTPPRVGPRRPSGADAARGRRARHRGEAGRLLEVRQGVVRPDRRRHLAVLPRADAGDARPDGRAAAPLRARRADAQERPAEPADPRAALVPAGADPHRPEPRELEGRDEARRGRGGARAKVRFEVPSDRAVPLAVNRGNPAVLTEPKADFSQRVREMAKALIRRRRPRPTASAGALAREGVGRMGLHDSIKSGRNGSATARRSSPTRLPRRARQSATSRSRTARGPVRRAEDAHPPRLHREARPGALHEASRPRTWPSASCARSPSSSTLDRTPLTREERRQLVREIADDILGYGPLEPFLADDTVTEVMVNSFDRIYVERDGQARAHRRRPSLDNAHLLRIIDKIVSQVGRRIDESSPMVDARLPDGSRVNAIIPPLALRGPTLTIRKFARDPYTMDDLITFGSLTPKCGPVPRRVRARQAQRPHLRRYRHR